jgi:leucyl aminopeptidase
MRALAGRKAKVNVVGIVGLVENMPDGNAQRPGDIVTSMSGQTIEVLNTDAEGRLVLADALWYCNQTASSRDSWSISRPSPARSWSRSATTMPACSPTTTSWRSCRRRPRDRREALAHAAGPAYDKLIDSKIADMKNIGGRYGGSITAAQFLQRFVKDVPWAHLDIAGVAWSKKDRRPCRRVHGVRRAGLLEPSVCVFFDAGDETALATTREDWRSWKAAGHTVKYFKQGERGGWEQAG